MVGHMPDYIADLLMPVARSSLRASRRGDLNVSRTCRRMLDVSTTESSRLLRRRLVIGADRTQATAIDSVIQTKTQDSSVLSPSV